MVGFWVLTDRWVKCAQSVRLLRFHLRAVCGPLDGFFGGGIGAYRCNPLKQNNLPKYSQEKKAEVLAATDIVELIGASVQLKSAGTGRFVGLCPFHQEKTPSFSVNRDRQFYHCFGCGKGGDAISFVMDHDGLTFGEALRSLADRAGIVLPTPTARDDAEDHRRVRLLDAGKAAQALFRQWLGDPMKGSLARQYLKSRNLRDETTKRFGLGFAPQGYEDLVVALRKKGFSEKELTDSGLVRQSQRGSIYAFFRNRLMVPIHDHQGRIVAFGGRDLGGEAETPKYINTPENVIYTKGRVLYGLYEARDALRHADYALVVEGYFDLMRCFDSGIENVVAPCGTALTADQAKLLKRYVGEAVLVFDGDRAGIQAALKAAGVVTAAGLTCRALVLPEGMDPDDFIRDKGVEAFRERIETAPDMVSFYVEANRDRLSTIEGRTDVLREVFTLLLHIQDSLRRDQYMREAAKQVGVDVHAAQREFKRLQSEQWRSEKTRSEDKATEAGGNKPVAPLAREDVEFVAALLAHTALREETSRRLKGLVMQPTPLTKVLSEVVPQGAVPAGMEWSSVEAQRLYAAAAASESPEEQAYRPAWERRLNRLMRAAFEARVARLHEDIRAAEQEKNTAKVLTLVNEEMGIQKRMRELGAL